jgi:hypothetical protein
MSALRGLAQGFFRNVAELEEAPSLGRITLPTSTKGLSMGSHDQQSHEVLRGPASGSRWIEHPWRADRCVLGLRLGLGILGFPLRSEEVGKGRICLHGLSDQQC